jgi:hypothetical protein
MDTDAAVESVLLHSKITTTIAKRCSEMGGFPAEMSTPVSHITGPLFGPGGKGIANAKALQTRLELDLGCKFDETVFQNKSAVGDLVELAEEVIGGKTHPVNMEHHEKEKQHEKKHGGFLKWWESMLEELAPYQEWV